MGIRFPLKNIQVINDNATSSVATGTIETFTVPQDTDNIVVKFVASIIGGGASAFLQTSDDGGTTWYDVGRTSVVSNSTQWLSAPVINAGIGATSASVSGTTFVNPAIGSTAASTLGIGRMSGLPILGTLNRIVLSYSAAGTSNDTATVDVKVNSESGTA